MKPGRDQYQWDVLVCVVSSGTGSVCASCPVCVVPSGTGSFCVSCPVCVVSRVKKTEELGRTVGREDLPHRGRDTGHLSTSLFRTGGRPREDGLVSLSHSPLYAGNESVHATKGLKV